MELLDSSISLSLSLTIDERTIIYRYKPRPEVFQRNGMEYSIHAGIRVYDYVGVGDTILPLEGAREYDRAEKRVSRARSYAANSDTHTPWILGLLHMPYQPVYRERRDTPLLSVLNYHEFSCYVFIRAGRRVKQPPIAQGEITHGANRDYTATRSLVKSRKFMAGNYCTRCSFPSRVISRGGASKRDIVIPSFSIV